MFFRLSFLSIVVVSIFAFRGCKSNNTTTDEYVHDNDNVYLNTAHGVKYIGSKPCASCHPDIYESFRQAEMGRSMSRVDFAIRHLADISVNTVYDSSGDFYYSMVWNNADISIHEYRLDAKRKVIHERVLNSEYVMGSGNNLVMLFHNEGGMLYEQPITWYVHKRKWDFSPGYKEFGNLRFSRFADARCISCHNSYLPVNNKANERYTEPFSLGIGCERCHGPGELHVKQKMGEKLADINEHTKTIVNPAKLSAERQLDVCRQCHLQGKAWAPHDAPDWFGFRPGMLLSANRSVYFPAATQKEVFEVADSPHRLSLSRCFKESNGKLTCITCHDPHLSIKTFRIDEYNRKCLACHPSEELAGLGPRHTHQAVDNCISCHMKSTGTDNTLHGVSNTDHWIRVGADETIIDWTTLRTPADRQPFIRLTPDVDADDDGKLVRLGMAYYDYYVQYDRRRAYLDSAYHYLSTGLVFLNDSTTACFYLGEVYRELGRFDDARNAYSRALALNPNLDKAAYQIGKVNFTQQHFSEAVQSFRQALALKPDDPEYLEALGMALAESGETDEAVKLLERSVAIDKQSPSAYSYLGNVYARSLNMPEKALPAFQRLVTLEPDFADGHLNLANTYAMTGNYDEATKEYRKEINAHPASASAYFNLGRVFELKGNKKEARGYYRKALDIDSSLQVAKEYLDKLQ
jgi:tetratricopeptide (TPR) repeat protein